MSVYIDYERFRREYDAIINKYDATLREKEYLFSKTQPGSPKWDKVGSGGQRNPFDEYLALKEKKQIDKRLDEIRSLLEDKKTLLMYKHQELMNSKDHMDKIYRMRYIENINVTRIAMNMNYSESQIYRILKNISNNLVLAT